MRNITDLGSFAVKNDGSEDFKKFVLEPLNEIRNIAISLQYVGANTEMYYGIDERGFPNCSYYYEGFSHILTVQQIKDYLLSGVRPGEEKKKDLRPALWLVAEGEYVLLKIEESKGNWITLIKERLDSPFSHIIEPLGIQNAIDNAKSSKL